MLEFSPFPSLHCNCASHRNKHPILEIKSVIEINVFSSIILWMTLQESETCKQLLKHYMGIIYVAAID